MCVIVCDMCVVCVIYVCYVCVVCATIVLCVRVVVSYVYDRCAISIYVYVI